MHEQHAAQVDARAAEVMAFGSPTEADMARINQIAKAKLAPEDVFVTRTIASHNDYDSYSTRMDHETTLPNYVRDAKSRSGVPILYGHLKGMGVLPIGRAFTGAMHAGAPAGAPKATHFATIDYYLPRHMQTPQGNTDDIIRAIETGTATDSSVGFGGKYKYRCDVCGDPDMLRSPDCTHWPGMPVYVNGKRTDLIATATIVNADLKELSPVWRGSAAGAEVIKRMEALLERGVLTRADIVELDETTGQRMAEAIDWSHSTQDRRFAMTAPKKEAEQTQDPAAPEDKGAAGALSGALDLLTSGPEPKAKDAPTPRETVQTGTPATTKEDGTHFAARLLEEHEVRSEADLTRLLAEAEDGRSYRVELVAMCHRLGVRGQGSAYNEDLNARMLTHLDTKDLRAELESRTNLVKSMFRKDTPDTEDPLRTKVEQEFGGRQTVPASGPLGDRAPKTPDGAPRAGAADDKLFGAK